MTAAEACRREALKPSTARLGRLGPRSGTAWLRLAIRRPGLTDEAPAPGKIPPAESLTAGEWERLDVLMTQGPAALCWDRTGPPGPREMDEMILYRDGIMPKGYATMTDRRRARWCMRPAPLKPAAASMTRRPRPLPLLPNIAPR